ncbi:MULTISPECIES: ATP-binding protein [unclassified Streptomyces]|uniref:ATP-binding protein n=1 Tax=unclassified Streptomyces TaxID=2593676 RepID=UPI002036C3BA|nr:ATP-binding protein [Streptomyces sp. McG3]
MDRPPAIPTTPHTSGDGAPPGEMTACAGARAVITALLQPLKHASRQAEADAHLAVSELISNALRHGGGLTGFKADLDPAATRLRLQVEDPSPEPPRRRLVPDPETPGGRGWAIVKRIATTCSVAVLPGAGKRITVTIAI